MEKIIKIILSVVSVMIPELKKEDSKEGVEELKEAVIGVNEVALFLAVKLKDGFQVSDATDFYNKLTQDEEFKQVVTDAYEGYDKIPAEAKDLDVGEGLELASVQVGYLPKFVNAFKK